MVLSFFLGRFFLHFNDYLLSFVFSVEVRQIYPNKYITVDDRIYVFYTLFNLPGNKKKKIKIKKFKYDFIYFRNISYCLFN